MSEEKSRTANNLLNDIHGKPLKGVFRDSKAAKIINENFDRQSVSLTKKNIDQVKKLGKQNKDIIILDRSSSPTAIEHEAGHTRIKPNSNLERKSPSKRYNRITKRLERIAEENGASSRALENLKRIPGVDVKKSKEDLNTAIGTYIGRLGENINK